MMMTMLISQTVYARKAIYDMLPHVSPNVGRGNPFKLKPVERF